CDLGFWYQNLSAAHQELIDFPKDADHLTRSNQLMKLRETLVDQREKGPRVTLPPNIIYYPNQLTYRMLTIIGLSGGAIGLILFAGSYECQGHECSNH
ncbi:MAG: hypothetical protein AAGA30_09250, partial [Planctomycetota bacterium]